MRGPDQRVSRLGALKAVTSDAAYSLRLEKEVGSIVPGKLANFTILAENPVTCDPAKIKDIKIWGTIDEGRVLPVGAAPRVAARAPRATKDRQEDAELTQLAVDRLLVLLSHSEHEVAGPARKVTAP